MKKEVKETISQGVSIALSTLIVELVHKAMSFLSGKNRKSEEGE